MEAAVEKPRVLVVEDEPLIGAALEELLIELGYQVPRIIDSVDDVLPAVRDQRPDAVLMDVKLRSFNDGIDAARRLRLISKVPIIFLTAYTDDDTRARAQGVPNSVFLGKPLDERRLEHELSRLLDAAR